MAAHSSLSITDSLSSTTLQLPLCSSPLCLSVELCSREQKIWRVAIYALTFLAVLSGAYQALLAGRRYAAANFLRDSALPAMRQLAIMGRSAQGQSLDTNSLVLCTDVTVADTLPTVAPQPIMWAPHM